VKNTHSLQQLIDIAATTFQNEKYADIHKVHASEDGFVFIEENRAKIHCETIEGLKYHTITKIEALNASEDQDLESLISSDDVDLSELKARYEELYGKAAHHNIGEEKLKDLIAAKEEELNAVALNNKDDQNS